MSAQIKHDMTIGLQKLDCHIWYGEEEPGSHQNVCNNAEYEVYRFINN